MSSLTHAQVERGRPELGPWRAIVPSERMLRAQARIAQSDDPAVVVAEFWAGVGSTPLWEPDPELAGAWRATFLWRGVSEVTRHVALCGDLVFSELSGCLLAQIPDTDIWHVTLRLPAQTRATYVISPDGLLGMPDDFAEVVRVQATWVRDPLNPSTMVVPANSSLPEMTPRVSSLLEAPDAAAQRWRVRRAETAKGQLEEHCYSSAILQNERRIWAYTPAGWDPRKHEYPLMLAFDGWEVVNVCQLPDVLDNLIAAGEIPPIVAVLIDYGSNDMRRRELDCSEQFLTFLTDEILPWATDRWQLDNDRARTLVAGISLGGRAAVFAGLRRPDVFGKVIAQAAAITESEPPAIHAIANKPASRSARLELYFDTGLLEIDPRGVRAFLPGVRRLREVLRAAGHVVHHAEPACGHDSIAYGETIADGLRLLLPARER